jgi:hypothetical protein
MAYLGEHVWSCTNPKRCEVERDPSHYLCKGCEYRVEIKDDDR